MILFGVGISLRRKRLRNLIKEFLRNPESERYIEYAYKKFKLDKLAEEQEILRRELQDMK